MKSKVDNTCKICSYWTKNPSDKAFKCYTPECPAKIRDKKYRNNNKYN